MTTTDGEGNGGSSDSSSIIVSESSFLSSQFIFFSFSPFHGVSPLDATESPTAAAAATPASTESTMNVPPPFFSSSFCAKVSSSRNREMTVQKKKYRDFIQFCTTLADWVEERRRRNSMSESAQPYDVISSPFQVRRRRRMFVLIFLRFLSQEMMRQKQEEKEWRKRRTGSIPVPSILNNCLCAED